MKWLRRLFSCAEDHGMNAQDERESIVAQRGGLLRMNSAQVAEKTRASVLKPFDKARINSVEGLSRGVSFLTAVASLTVCLGLSSCGYTTRSMINSSYKTIYITPFVNKVDITGEFDSTSGYKVYRPMLESDITRTLTRRFLMDGNLKPVDKDNADLILKGELVEFRRDPLRYNTDNEVDEYRMNLLVNISLWEAGADKPLWEERNFTGDTTYFVRGAATKSENSAVNDALLDLSRRIVERTVEQW
ncbi:MAG: LPS assembly lipoprotein LptE [Candidatus Omnitrophota bacterium]|jgi:hypothetical protein